MAKLCKDHIIDRDNKHLDLSLWLDDVFTKHKFKYFPKIIMGGETFDIFKTIVQEIEMSIFGSTVYKFNGFEIPKSWITIDHNLNPYYIRITWEIPEVKTNHDLYGHSIQKVFYDEFIGLDRWHGFQKVPHIDHVKFNGPATIVFWKDGTKTVVKHDGTCRKDKRQAILYAFIRKIYGEGKPYHNILNEIEEAIEEPSISHTCVSCKYGDQLTYEEPCKSCDASFSNWEAEK